MMTRMHRTLSILALLMGGLLATTGINLAHAQSGMQSVGAVATGGGTSALDTGPSALYSNPANLTVGPHTHTIEVQLFRTSVYTGGDFYQFNHINSLFYNNEEAPSNEKEKAVLDKWFGNGMRRANTYVEMIPFSLTYRPTEAPWAAGFGLRSRLFQTSAVNKGLFDVLLRGTSPDRTIPINGRTRLYSTVDIAGSFSYRLSSLPLSVGASPRLILGMGYADGTLDSRAVVSGDSLVHRFDYTTRAAGPVSTGLYDTFSPFSSEPVKIVGSTSGIAGTGFGIDFGATYTIRPDLHVSASVTDLGLISWTQDAQTVTPTDNSFRFEGVELDLEQLDSEYDGDVNAYVQAQIDSLAKEAYGDAERDRSSFTTDLPTTLHVNGTWDSPVGVGSWLEVASLNGGVSIGMNKEAGAVPDPAAVHVGGTVNLGPVPIRTGVRFWGTQAVTLSGGIGLDVGAYRFDLGTSITPSTSTLGSGARYAITLSLATIRF